MSAVARQAPSAEPPATAGRAVVILEPRHAELIVQARPVAREDEVVVRTEATLVSPGTELAFFEGTHAGLADPTFPFAKYPFSPGYAALGTVLETGARVRAPLVGRRVFYFGRHASFGCFAPERSCWVEVSDDLPTASVLLLRMVQIAATATCVWRRQPARVLVLGAGLVGILAAQICRLKGVPAVAIQDVNPARLALAARCGIGDGVLATNNTVPADPSLWSGEAPDCIIEATGVPLLVPSALRGVKRGGDVILLGSPRGSAPIELYKDVHHKGAALIGAHEALLPEIGADGGADRRDLIQQALGWLRAGTLRLDGLVTHRIRPEELPATYAQMALDKSATLGVLVDWS